MKIYIDYDDCLCETARAFTGIAERLFGKTVPYEDVRFFNLQDSFKLTDDEYQQLMVEGHLPEVLLSFEETPGASKVINEWIDKGYEVDIITGRPYSTYEVSKQWLDEHGLERVNLFFLNKYGRDLFYKNQEKSSILPDSICDEKDASQMCKRALRHNAINDYNLELDDFYKMKFDYAIEDSPMAFKFFEHLPELKVLVYDRPWNCDCDLPNGNYYHCMDWECIRGKVI